MNDALLEAFHFFWLKILDVFSTGPCFWKVGKYSFCILIELSKLCFEHERYLLPVTI